MFLSRLRMIQNLKEWCDYLLRNSCELFQAILGDTVEITTVDGNVNLKIPSGTQPNTTLSLENKGVPRLGNPVARGNHEVLVKVKLPTRITDEERKLLEGLASQYSDKNINSRVDFLVNYLVSLMTSLKHLDLKSVPCPLNIVKIKLALRSYPKMNNL